MAVIKIKTIKKNLQAVVNYAKNGEKTEHGILVSGVNCLPQSAYEQMTLTKKFYHKENKTLGFHIIQSFKGQEVSPQKANQIGKELARNKFESVAEVKKYKTNIEKELPILKGQREILWRNYNKSVNENDKSHILKEINQLTEKIDISHAQKNACIRIINRYAQIKENYKNEIESKNKAAELIKEDKKKKLRCR